MDGIDQDLLLQSINEVYFGKTEQIKQIEKELDILRRNYMGSDRIPLNDTHLLRIKSLIEEYFGFGKFNLHIQYNLIPEASTLPMSYNILADKNNNYIVDTNGYKFKREYNYKCVVVMTTALIFNPIFTTEEIMACLLYELGFNLFSCMSSNNAMLSNLYITCNIAKQVASIVQTFIQSKKIAEEIRVIAARQSADKQSLSEIRQNKNAMDRFMSLSDEDKRKVLDNYGQEYFDLVNEKLKSKDSEIIKKNMLYNLISIFMNSDILQRFKLLFHKTVHRDKSIQNTAISLSHRIALFIKYGLSFVKYIPNFLFSDKSKKTILIMTIKDILFPLKSVLSKAKNPLTWLSMPVDFKVDQAAGTFATMYGYGPALTSYFSKMKSNTRIECLNKFLNNYSFVSVAYDCITLPMRVLYGVFDSNPSNLSRCYDQLEMLSRELEKTNLTDDMKSELQKDIKDCKIQIKELTDISRGLDNPDICKALYYKAIDEVFKGVGLNEFIFSSNKRFDEYDKNIESLKQECSIDMNPEIKVLIEGGLLENDSY